MAHIKKINEMVNVNENVNLDFSSDLLRNILDNDEFSVRIVKCGGNTNYKNNQMEEYLSDFFYEFKEIENSINGTCEIITDGSEYNAYKITIKDQNNKEYAWAVFQLLYNNIETLDVIKDYYNTVED